MVPKYRILLLALFSLPRLVESTTPTSTTSGSSSLISTSTSSVSSTSTSNFSVSSSSNAEISATSTSTRNNGRVRESSGDSSTSTLSASTAESRTTRVQITPTISNSVPTATRTVTQTPRTLTIRSSSGSGSSHTSAPRSSPASTDISPTSSFLLLVNNGKSNDEDAVDLIVSSPDAVINTANADTSTLPLSFPDIPSTSATISDRVDSSSATISTSPTNTLPIPAPSGALKSSTNVALIVGLVLGLLLLALLLLFLWHWKQRRDTIRRLTPFAEKYWISFDTEAMVNRKEAGFISTHSISPVESDEKVDPIARHDIREVAGAPPVYRPPTRSASGSISTLPEYQTPTTPMPPLY
ncbi:protein kinase and ribonuclease [Moniliophthora roreri]|uniref:Uncharacterized protein n=1 Tax=Moniliophthora roreri TaxID=221103 RepID=A0A0W0G5D5_MONRR|nr:protein kinase and ribonuclease [Moniliophthora roreri]